MQTLIVAGLVAGAVALLALRVWRSMRKGVSCSCGADDKTLCDGCDGCGITRARATCDRSARPPNTKPAEQDKP